MRNNACKKQSANRQIFGFCYNSKLFFAAFFLFLSVGSATSQVTYTLGNGTLSSPTLGVNPFATINMNSRSQYLFLSQELLDQGAISGNITSMALNITVLGLPEDLEPENVSIKLGMTDDVTLGTTLIDGLQTYYTSEVETISSTGWRTFTFTTPFEWDGLSNIIVEICRSNAEFGTSFEVQSTLYNVEDYRTIGLYSNETIIGGCELTGTSPMTTSNRRIRPNAKFTMTNPCDGIPTAGTTVVTAGPYCSGTPFTLSIQDGAMESGLYYQWQSSPNGNGLWEDIAGANSGTFTTTQSIATYYRRATTCIESQQTINSLAVFVDGEGCYCNAQVVNENEIGISNVTFADINNSTVTTPLYNNFTIIQTQVAQSGLYNLSARVTTNGMAVYTKAWIDWNQNAIYDDSEGYDLGSVTGGTNVPSGFVSNLTVPADALLGPTTMRVRASYDAGVMSFPPACGPVPNGETEDYRIIVTEDLGVENPVASSISVLAFASAEGINIASRNTELQSVAVYDLSGRLLANKTNIASSQSTLQLNAKNQIVMVKITTSNGSIINKKVVL